MRVGKRSAQLFFTGSKLYRFEVPIGRNANLLKIGVNMGRSYQIFISNKLDLTFRAPNHCAKFHQDWIKIAAVGVFTEGQTEWQKWFYNLAMLCYNSGTDKNHVSLGIFVVHYGFHKIKMAFDVQH